MAKTKVKGLCGHCRTSLTEHNCAPVTLLSGYGFCRDCKNEASRLRYRRNPKAQKIRTERYLSSDESTKKQNKRVVAWRRRKELGITQEEFDIKFENQNGLCAICKQPMAGQSHTKVPCQDHDHISGKIRDLLCVNCNILLGNCFESVEILVNAIEYLQKHSEGK